MPSENVRKIAALEHAIIVRKHTHTMAQQDPQHACKQVETSTLNSPQLQMNCQRRLSIKNAYTMTDGKDGDGGCTPGL